MTAPQPLSIFDMDRTITRTGTWTPWLLFWARREAPWRLLLLPLLALAGLAALAGLIGRARLKELSHRLLMGRAVPRDRLAAAAEAYADRVLADNVFPGAVARIAADRAEGRRLVLATASNEFYVVAIARRLGFDDVVATASRWDEDVLRHRLAGENCYGQAKLLLVEAFLKRAGLEGAPIRFYSDHVSDAPLFERATEQVATTPSKRLRRLAAERGWQVVDWGKPARGLFERA
jgi:HAD superfamily hydrolase (TIGR01490 family)